MLISSFDFDKKHIEISDEDEHTNSVNEYNGVFNQQKRGHLILISGTGGKINKLDSPQYNAIRLI